MQRLRIISPVFHIFILINCTFNTIEHSELKPNEHREILASEIYLMNNKPDCEDSELYERLKGE